MPYCISQNCSHINRTVENTETTYTSIHYLVINFVISGLTILVNHLTIFVYLYKRRILLKPPSNNLLFSLMICHLILAIGTDLNLVTHMNPDLGNHSTNSAIMYRVFVDVFNTFGVYVIATHLCGITLDRCCATFYAYRYESLVTPNNVLRFILFAWVFPLIASIVQFTWLLQAKKGDTREGKDEIAKFDIWYSAISFLVFLVVPTFLMGIAFVAMFVKIRFIISRIETGGRFTQEVRLLFLFNLSYLCFLALVMPYFSLRLVIDICIWQGTEKIIDPNIYYLTSTLKNLSPLINPILYSGTCPQFQNQLKELLCKRTDQCDTTTAFLNRHDSQRVSCRVSREFQISMLHSSNQASKINIMKDEVIYDSSGHIDIRLNTRKRVIGEEEEEGLEIEREGSNEGERDGVWYNDRVDKGKGKEKWESVEADKADGEDEVE